VQPRAQLAQRLPIFGVQAVEQFPAAWVSQSLEHFVDRLHRRILAANLKAGKSLHERIYMQANACLSSDKNGEQGALRGSNMPLNGRLGSIAIETRYPSVVRLLLNLRHDLAEPQTSKCAGTGMRTVGIIAA